MSQRQQLGGGCHLSTKATKRRSCASYDGQDAEGCTMGPKGRCRLEELLAKAYRPKFEPTAAQLAALAAARAAHSAKAAARRAQKGGYMQDEEEEDWPQDWQQRQQNGGAGAMKGCHRSTRATKRKTCAGYDGEDADGCVRGPKGRCRSASGLARSYRPKRAATPAQLAALAKGRAVLAAKRAAARRS